MKRSEVLILKQGWDWERENELTNYYGNVYWRKRQTMRLDVATCSALCHMQISEFHRRFVMQTPRSIKHLLCRWWVGETAGWTMCLVNHNITKILFFISLHFSSSHTWSLFDSPLSLFFFFTFRGDFIITHILSQVVAVTVSSQKIKQLACGHQPHIAKSYSALMTTVTWSHRPET